MEPIARTKPLYQRAYESITGALLSGDIKAGERLTEVGLAQKLGISRSPVREALRQLQKDGLVEVNPNGEVRVAVLDQDEARDLWICRKVLEELAAGLAAEHATDAKIREMRDALDAAAQSYASGERMKMLILNTRFHDAVLEATKNQHLCELIHRVRKPLLVLRISMLQYETNPGRIIDEHRAVFDAIRSGDTEHARRMMAVHMNSDQRCWEAAFSAAEAYRIEAR